MYTGACHATYQCCLLRLLVYAITCQLTVRIVDNQPTVCAVTEVTSIVGTVMNT